ncbi:MAG: sulfatase-like hydrolase/transferase [Bryobacteraceae bacterium]
MSPARVLSFLLRVLFAAYFLLTSLYSLLAFIPFTYEQVHKGALIPALKLFGQWNHWLYWIALFVAAAIWLLEPFPAGAHGRRVQRWRLGFFAVHIPVGLLLSFHPLIASLENTFASYLIALGALTPVLWLAADVWRERWSNVSWREGEVEEVKPVFRAAAGAGVFVSLVYSLIAWSRGGGQWTVAEGAFALLTSLLLHLVAFVSLFAALDAIAVVAGWFDKPPRNHFLLCHLLGCVILFVLIRALVFPAISFQGWWPDLYAALLSFTITAFLMQLCVWLIPAGSGRKISSGLALALWLPSPPPAKKRRWLLPVQGLLLAAAAAWLAVNSSRNDWNYLIQKLTSLLIWVAAFQWFYRTTRAVSPAIFHGTGRILIIAFAILPVFRATELTERVVWKHISSKQTLSRFLDRYAGFDPSFKLVHDALATGQFDPGFYRFLTRNTSIPRSTRIRPVEVKLAAEMKPATGARPHIFVFVVDSLRRDYLSPYNPDVDFTPEINAFARDSVVFKNSFTRYGGTGLSEPSIWVGGAMIHQQYVTPFRPMNALQTLLETDSYQALITRDSILNTLITPWPGMSELDAGVVTMNLDLCNTLQELQRKLPDAAAKGPVFAYTQPQNIHISVINREGQKAIDEAGYRAYYAPYASRIRRMDACFGTFVRFLKQQGLYDSSIIALTSDHGDSLGESGRWGHAYTIYPEIVRVPLILHVPPSLMGSMYVDKDLVAFNSDITPTLYYLLGHRPVTANPLFGRPLVTETPRELSLYRREIYLVTSSYAAVYGVLSGDGRTLYTSDAVNYRDSWFDLTETMPSARSVPSAMKLSYENMIRERIALVSKFYDFKLPADGSSH